MMKRLFTLLNLLIISLPASATPMPQDTPLSVVVAESGKQFQFHQATRLSAVVKTLEQHKVSIPYPLAATLFDQSPTAVETVALQKRAVLQELRDKGLDTHPFYGFIEQSKFAYRTISHLDIDKIRLHKNNDPLLKGQFSILNPRRASSVTVLGNVESIHTMDNVNGKSLSELMPRISSKVGKIKYPPVLIFPDGNTTVTHLGAWLSHQYYLPPQSIIYIPFSEYHHSDLDKNIVKLLTNLKSPL